MVRTYKRKREKTYSTEDLFKALEAVKTKKMNSYEASKVFGIPRSTISARISGARGAKMPSAGKPTVFPKKQEEHLASLLHVMEKTGYPLTRKEVKILIADYVRRNGIDTPVKNEIPGDDWCKRFFTRNNLSLKKPQGVEVARKRACNPFNVYSYFQLLEKTIKELGLGDKPERIFNLDETSFCNDPSSSKIVGKKGYQSTRTTSGPGRDNTTVLLAANAQGGKIPPLIVFKGKSLWNEWFYKNENVQTAYSVSKNGWMESSIFEKYLKNVFLPSIGNERPVLLVYDGHKTHIDLNVVEFAAANNITILKLPPHSSHILQPLDCSTMKAMKVKWEDALVKWQRLHSGAKLPKNEFARLLTEIWDNLNPVVLQNGFRGTGLYPVDRNAISKEKFDIMAWSNWETYLTDKTRSIEIVQEELHTDERQSIEIDQKKEEQTRESIYGDFKMLYSAVQVPSLSNLVLKHINDQYNNNICKKTMINETKQIRTDKKEVIDTYKNVVKNPETFILNPPKKSVSSKQISAGTSSVKILDCQIIKKGISSNEENVSFEELLLKSIARNDPPRNPRKRVKNGAEILTYQDVIISMKKEKENKDLEIKKKETLKRIKIEGRTKTETKKKANQKEKKYIQTKKTKINKKTMTKNRHDDSSDTDSTGSYSLQDSSDYEDAPAYFQSLLRDELEEEDMITNIKEEITKKPKRQHEPKRNSKTKMETETVKYANSPHIYNIPSTSKEEVEEEDLCLNLEEGSFLLAKFSSAKGKKEYKYVCLVEEISEGKIVVKGCKSYKKNKKVFRTVENDISTIDLAQIVMFLPMPTYDERENVFIFPFDVDIMETETVKYANSPHIYNIPSTSREEVEEEDLCLNLEEGSFLLAKFSSAKGKKEYKYVCLVEEILVGKIVVKGCKSYKKNKKVFRTVENDISTIDLAHIVMFLPMPTYDERENVFIFPFDVDIMETETVKYANSPHIYNIPSTSKEEEEEEDLCLNLEEGSFLLAKFSSAKGKKEYKYVCLVEEISVGKIVVKGCKSYKKNKKIFRTVENDISIIDIAQIVMFLPMPTYDERENFYIFPIDVDIMEL